MQTQISKLRSSVDLQAMYDSLIKVHSENTDYRMQNYLNCVDDYSWGGLCDQAQSEKESQIRRLISKIKEQEENGGFLIETVSEFELRSIDGSFISKNIVEGKFGKCFMWGTEEDGRNFCGLLLKQSTYAKKGYACITKTYRLKVVYTGFISSKGNCLRTVELIDVVESIDDKINYASLGSSNYSMYVLRNNNNETN